MANFVERGLIDGSIESFETAAELVGVSRVRLSQIMRLLDLEPAVQERVLLKQQGVAERGLRLASMRGSWETATS